MINSMIKECEVDDRTDEPPPDYGVDYGGPLPDDQVGTVCIPETLCPLNNEEIIDRFMDHIDTNTN